MTSKNKDYKVGTYKVKKERLKNDRPMCPTCSKCLNKDYCNREFDTFEIKKSR